MGNHIQCCRRRTPHQPSHQIKGIDKFRASSSYREALVLPISAFTAHIFNKLSLFGFTSQNTLCGISICPDEINHQPGCFSDHNKLTWGQIFPMGGLSGIPFAGKTGYTAFKHHVPENGHIYICYGSHIGITQDGEIGKIKRVGIAEKTSCCGAAIAALNCLKHGIEKEWDDLDMQQCYLVKSLQKYKQRILNASEEMVQLAFCNYLVIDEYIKGIVDRQHEGKIVLCGGVYLNTDGSSEDIFIGLNLQILQKHKPDLVLKLQQ